MGMNYELRKAKLEWIDDRQEWVLFTRTGNEEWEEQTSSPIKDKDMFGCGYIHDHILVELARLADKGYDIEIIAN